MKTIKLPETDISGMRQFYKEELEKTLKRLQHIQSVLSQLGDKSVVIDQSLFDGTSLPGTSYIGETEKNQPKRKYRKRAGRKAMWGPIILKRMKQINRPLTYDELTDEIMTFSNLPEDRRAATKQAVVNVTFRLRTQEKKIDTFSNGKREKYLGLKSWFDEDGKILEAYRLMLPHPMARYGKGEIRRYTDAEAFGIPDKPATTQPGDTPKRKRGRPRKNPLPEQPTDATPKTPISKLKTSTTNQTVESQTTNKPTPKRGRPPKTKP